SPRTYPLACASNVLHRPSEERKPALAKLADTSGRRIRFTPPATADSDSPSQRLRQARWTATREDEQAVSIARLGPRKSRWWETRLAAMRAAPPVIRYPSMAPPRIA